MKELFYQTENANEIKFSLKMQKLDIQYVCGISIKITTLLPDKKIISNVNVDS